MNETDYSRYTVLVVDDIPVNILLVKGMLSRHKFQIASANSGQQALELLTTLRPDIILMDIMMPGMNGFETTRAIRANAATRDIPVIILSALNSDSDIKEGLEAGANEFITKPFIQERIVNSIVNQIKLSESRRTRSEAESAQGEGGDAAARLLAYLVHCGDTAFAMRLADRALCVPQPVGNGQLDELKKELPESVDEWAFLRIRQAKLKPVRLSASECMAQAVALMAPAAALRKVRFQTQMTGDLGVKADLALLKAIFTNLLSCACRLAKDEVRITGVMDGGLANLMIAFETRTAEADPDTDLHVAMALEAASRMNGAVVCERENERQYVFQIILQQ